MDERASFPPAPFTPSEIRSFITAALKNPHNPVYCSGSLTSALQALAEHEEYVSDCLTDEESRCQKELCKTLYRFVIASRSSLRLKSWMEQFAWCADCKGKRHRTSMSSFFHIMWEQKKGKITSEHVWFSSKIARQEAEEMFPASSSAFLVSVIDMLSNILTRTRFKIVSQARSREWPSKMSHLMPLEPDQVIGSLLHWHRTYPKPNILRLLTLVICLVRFPAHTALHRHNFAAVTMNSAKRIIDLMVSVLDSTPIEPLKAEFKWLCETFVNEALNFFKIVGALTAPYLPGETKLFLMDGCATKAVQLCSLIHSLCPTTQRLFYDEGFEEMSLEVNFETLMTCSRSFGHTVYRTFRIQDTVNPSQPDTLHAVGVAEQDRDKFFGPHDGFEAEIGLSLTWRNGLDYGCFAKLCNIKKTSDGATLKVKICGGCLGAYYCGIACQTKDWNDNENPHRKICPILSRVTNQIQPMGFRIMGGQRRSTVPLKYLTCKSTDLETINSVRDMVKKGNLYAEEVKVLKEWGKSIYHIHSIKCSTWSAGFDDYAEIMAHMSDPGGVFGLPQAVYFNGNPSEATLKGKALLTKQPF